MLCFLNHVLLWMTYQSNEEYPILSFFIAFSSFEEHPVVIFFQNQRIPSQVRKGGFTAADNVIVGNVCLYGASSGAAYFSGRAVPYRLPFLPPQHTHAHTIFYFYFFNLMTSLFHSLISPSINISLSDSRLLKGRAVRGAQ